MSNKARESRRDFQGNLKKSEKLFDLIQVDIQEKAGLFLTEITNIILTSFLGIAEN